MTPSLTDSTLRTIFPSPWEPGLQDAARAAIAYKTSPKTTSDRALQHANKPAVDVFIEDFKARIERQKAMSACDESVTAGLELASLGTRRSMEMLPHESVKVDILICSLLVDAAAKLHVLGRDHRSVKHSAYMMARHIEAVAPNHDCEYHRRVIAAALAP